MSSKIKVDTIENVAGSGNVSLGSGHNLVVPGNITGSGTATITGASTFTGGLKTGGTAGVSSAPIATIISGGNSLEWGHGNSAGYRSTLGALSGGGQPFVAWSAEHGTNANTYRTRGLKGHVIQTNNAGDLQFKAIQTANADNQTGQPTVQITNDGHVTITSQPYVQFQGGSGANTSITHGEYFGNTTQGNPAFSTSGSNLARMQGITYDSSNGLFTVPTGGLYLINFQGYYNAGASVVRVDIIINGVQMALGHIGTHVGTVSTQFAATMAANDYVGFRQISGSSGTTQDWYMGPAHMIGYIVKVA